MNALTTIQIQTAIPFPPKINHGIFRRGRVPVHAPAARKKGWRARCKLEREVEPHPEGEARDKRRQEILAQLAMLQAQKMQVTEFLDERAAFLTRFHQDTDAEFDQIGHDALQGLDEAEARMLENIESRMQAFEETAELNRNEIEMNEQKLSQFEDKIDRDCNEGLFLKNMRLRTPTEQAYSKEEMQKIRDIEKGNAGSETRRNIYLGLICLLVVAILNAIITLLELECRFWNALSGLDCSVNV